MINDGVCIECPGRLRLMPYLPYHVPRYHQWMCDPELLAATESDPLSLEEEQENQDAWLHSTEKLTFIITAPVTPELPASRAVDPGNSSPYARSVEELAAREEEQAASALPVRYVPRDGPVNAFTMAPVSSLDALRPTGEGGASRQGGFVMAGDCNLFLLSPDEIEVVLEAERGGTRTAPHVDNGDEKTVQANGASVRVFEVEVMIAEKQLRRGGLAQLAVRMLLQYAIAVLGATHFVAKILDDNAASIALFSDKLGFRPYKEVKVFHEVHFVRRVFTDEEKATWQAECDSPMFFAALTDAMKADTLCFDN